MLKRVINGFTAVLGAPKDWDPERDGDCLGLAVRVHPHGAGPGQAKWIESAWEPTPAELDQIMVGHSLILRIVGWQPPVALYVEAEATPERDCDIRWIVRESFPGNVDDELLFDGPDAKDRAQDEYEARRGSGRASLFREVARG